MDNMSEKIEVFPQKQKSHFTRRDFLKWSAVAAGGAILWPWMKDRGEQTVAHSGLELLEDPEKLDGMINLMGSGLENFALSDKRFLGAPVIKINPNYRLILTQLTEAVNNYRRQSGKVYFPRIEGYESDAYYLRKIKETMDSPNARRERIPGDRFFMGYNLSVLRDLHEANFPSGIKEIVGQSQSHYTSFLGYIFIKSGIFDRVSSRTGLDLSLLKEGWRSPKWENFTSVHRQVLNIAAKEEFERLKALTESQVARNSGSPVSASSVLEILLNDNHGDLAKSIRDLEIFLRFMARNSLENGNATGESEDSVKNQKWMSDNILDEYGRIGSYHALDEVRYKYVGNASWIPPEFDLTDDTDQDLSRINQVGKPFHSWTSVSLLDVTPPMVIKQAIVALQAYTMYAQGPLKTAADFRTLLELNAIEKFVTTL